MRVMLQRDKCVLATKSKCPFPVFHISATPPSSAFLSPASPPVLRGAAWLEPLCTAPWAGSHWGCECVCGWSCGEETALEGRLGSMRAGAIDSWHCSCMWNWAGERLTAVQEQGEHIPSPCQPRAPLCWGTRGQVILTRS